MPDLPTFIRFDDVARTYRRGSSTVHALRGVDLALAPHSFTAVVGRSGSGKSTLMHLLAAMEQPTRGQITVGEWTVTDLDRDERARYRREVVGMIFQQFNLVASMDAVSNVELPLVLAGVEASERRRRAEAMLAQVGLSDRTTHRPAELSGGEQQRVAIARAFVNNPTILFADEPTGELDTETGRAVADLLFDLNRTAGTTLVLVTHDEELASRSARIIRLRGGMIESDSAHYGADIDAVTATTPGSQRA